MIHFFTSSLPKLILGAAGFIVIAGALIFGVIGYLQYRAGFYYEDDDQPADTKYHPHQGAESMYDEKID